MERVGVEERNGMVEGGRRGCVERNGMVEGGKRECVGGEMMERVVGKEKSEWDRRREGGEVHRRGGGGRRVFGEVRLSCAGENRKGSKAGERHR